MNILNKKTFYLRCCDDDVWDAGGSGCFGVWIQSLEVSFGAILDYQAI